MEILIFCKCKPSRLRGGGGWSCPDEEVLNSSHAMPQQRGLARLTVTATGHCWSVYPLLQLMHVCIKPAASEAGNKVEAVISQSPLPFCSSKKNLQYLQNLCCQALACQSKQLGHQLVVCWLIFQDGKILMLYVWAL